jgi:hypothetical protein
MAMPIGRFQYERREAKFNHSGSAAAHAGASLILMGDVQGMYRDVQPCTP